MKELISDSSWLRRSFVTDYRALDSVDKSRRTHSNAFDKFTDTTPGGNFAINNPPQFTRYADLKVGLGGRVDNWGDVDREFSKFNGSKGMGRYYSEAMDDNSHLIHMRFGVSEYNSLTSFFTRMYSSEAGALANIGKSTDILFGIGKILGLIISVPLVPFTMAGRIYKFLANKPYNKWYYLKPTMPLYWSAVNNIINSIAVDLGLTPSAFNDKFDTSAGNTRSAADTSPSALTPQQITEFNRILPEVFRGGGGIDIRSVATRATRLQQRYEEQRANLLQNIESREDLASIAQQSLDMQVTDRRPRPMDEYIDAYHKSTIGAGNGGDAEKQDPLGSWEPGFFEHFQAELREGSSWITMRVNHPGSVSESFSNSVGESSIASTINSQAASSRSTEFSFAGGNLGDGMISGAIEGLIGGVKKVASGILDGVGASGLAVLGGKAFVDIPQVWQGSTANLPTNDYTINLRSPYGNKMSLFLNLYMPLSMLLAAALPISTGRSTYTSPFLVELYDRGRNQVKVGMIESLSITRGVGNLGWSVDNIPTAIDVSFSVVDMTSIMHMPLGDSGLFEDDNAYTDYIATLAGLGLQDQTLASKRLKRRMSKAFKSFEEYTDVSHLAAWSASTLPGQLLTAIARVSDRD